MGSDLGKNRECDGEVEMVKRVCFDGGVAGRVENTGGDMIAAMEFGNEGGGRGNC